MSGIVDFVSTTPECPTCKVYREWLDQEKEKREYYEKIVLYRSGVIRTEDEEQILSPENFPSINRITTLSHLRKVAADRSRQRAKETTDLLAENHEKTEAELIFEKELKNEKEAGL